MPKDSQMDNKKTRNDKSVNQIPLTRENQNQNHNAKKESQGQNTKH